MFRRLMDWLARRAHAQSVRQTAELHCAERGDKFTTAPVLPCGQSLVEFILIFPLVFLLIVNAINFGAFFFAWITVANAARAGSQYWALGAAAVGTPTPATAAQVTSVVATDISSLLNRASLVVRACRNNNGSVTCSGAGSGTPPADPEASNYISASVDVTYTYQPPIPLFSFPAVGVYVTLPPTTIHRQSVMRMLQ
ncbi:MAG TPA: TadE family protein [Bryobacteraceae bacterium]|nr:TadE family protein [Bryobacteraceae bacterium]